MVTGQADAALAQLFERDAGVFVAEVAACLCGRDRSVFCSRGFAVTTQVITTLLAALRRDLVDGSVAQLRAVLPSALALVTDEAIGFPDLKLLGETLRSALRARCEASAVSRLACSAVEDWCFELAYQSGLGMIYLRDELINRQTTELAGKLAEQRQLSRLVGELREEIRGTKALGQYTLQSKIGEGGMGIVYRARHALLRRPTAIKLLSPERTSEEDLRRFEREVRLTARLTHPNTVTVFDFGRTPEGAFYYAMELLDGGTLQDIVEIDGPQPQARVAHVLQMVAGALAEAHGIGLIHSDIKPANIMLCKQGGEHDVAKVLDFGLVKRIRAEADVALSESSLITGTPYYMAPEAIVDPQSIDGRSDLYALGAVGYYLLTGHTVFEGSSSIEVLSHHLHSEPVAPAKRLGRPLSAELESVLLSCLKKKPDERPRTASELRRWLKACSNVGTWEPAEARAWWERHAAAIRARHILDEDITIAKTVDVNLHVLRNS